MKYKKKVLIIVLSIWIGILLYFSLQSSEASNNMSRLLAQRLDALLGRIGIEKNGLTEQEQIEYYNIILRSFAHLFIYFVLGKLSNELLLKTKVRYKKIIAICFCVFLAIMGEIVQLYIDGRTARVRDVLVDSAGAVIGVVFVPIHVCVEKLKFILMKFCKVMRNKF